MTPKATVALIVTVAFYCTKTHAISEQDKALYRHCK